MNSPERVEKQGFCSLCRSRCGTINVVEAGRLVEVRPDPTHPTGQALCPKGRAAPEIAHSAQRLERPLRRTRAKGDADPGWVEISWQDAMAEIAERLAHFKREHGAESVAFAVTSQSSSAISDSTEWVQRLIQLYGSPNNCMAVELCNWHKDYGHAFTFGCGLPTPDYAHADLIVLWGHDPANSWLAQANAIAEARTRGARLLVVDPHKSGSALTADAWYRIRPGTDGALALGIARLLIDRKGFDRQFMEQWSNGPFLVREDTGLFLRGKDLGWTGDQADAYVVWDASAEVPAPSDAQGVTTSLWGAHSIRARDGDVDCRTAFERYAEACAEFTPERVAEICWIGAQEVEALGDAFLQAKSIAYYGWNGIAQHTNATQTDRAIALLHALKGCFDAPGGNVLFTRHPVRRVSGIALMRPESRAKALGLGERPLGPPSMGWITSKDLHAAVLEGEPYRVRALVAFGTNLLVSHPDPHRSRQALEALEFQVHCDPFMNPTAEYADIVLPVSSPWERESLRVGFEISQAAEELVLLRQSMVAPRGESRSDMEIVFDLACRLGLEAEFFGGSIDAGWNHVLEPMGIDVARLRASPAGIRVPLEQRYRKYRDTGFQTQTRRVEVYSELFARHGHPPVPLFAEPADVPTTEFPLVLTTGNRGNFRHSQDRGIASLRKRAPFPEIRIHPETGRRRGVDTGDWVTIRSRVGRSRMRVRVDDSIHPAVVVADYGFWQECADLGLTGSPPGDPEGSNYNNLISNQMADPVSGALPLRSFACQVELSAKGAWPGFLPFVVRARRDEAPGVCTLELVPEQAFALPAFLPGQHLTVRFSSGARSYSLSCAADRRPSGYEITVKRQSGISMHIHDDVVAGHRVEVRAPAGQFVIPRATSFPLVLVAAGIGITPFIGYLRSLEGAASEPRIVLHYADREERGRAFADELDRLAKRLPNLSVIHHLSRPKPGDRFDRPGRIGAADISQDLIAQRARFFLCGPAPMMESMTRGLLERGVMRFEIFQELFQAPNGASEVPQGPFSIELARSRRTVTWTARSGTILDCLESEGLSMAAGCRVGQCESCSTAILRGSARHLVEVAAPDDASCLTCQAVPISDLVLDA